jgi:hypothetical protein
MSAPEDKYASASAVAVADNAPETAAAPDDTTGPKAAGPQAAGPQAVGPKATGPEATGPESTAPDSPSPKTAEADATQAESSPQRTFRWWVGRFPRLAWCVGLTVVGVVLFLCYLQLSRTERVTSDGASNALQAWDMLHGNPLLRGWTVTDVSFYTTELPEYMLVEAVRGLHADVLHVSAAITYTLVVITGGLLARGRTTGREGIVRMLIAAGIMIAPQIGPGVFILIFQPDHIGTQVPLLLTWLLLDRAPRYSPTSKPLTRAWYVPVLVGAMLAWVEVADRLAVLIGAVPLAVVCAVRAYQSVVQRREQLVAAWFDVSLVVAAGVSVGISDIVVKQIGAHGGFSVLPVASGLSPVSLMPNHSWLAVESVFGLYGADFFGMSSPGLAALIAFLHLFGLALAVWSLWLVIRNFFSCEDRIAQVLAAGIVINLAAYVLSTTPTTYWSARELAGVLPAGAVLAGRMLSGRLRRARLVPALSVVLACYLAALGYSVTQPSRSAFTQNLADWLVAHHFSYGLSSYGVANTTTLSSGAAVDIRPLAWSRNVAAPGPHEFDRAWYNPQVHDANFVVLKNHAVAANGITAGQVRAAFGRPSRVYDVGTYVVWTYNTNLLTDLHPSLPQIAG